MTVIQGGAVIEGAQERPFNGATITVGAEAGDAINVAVQLTEGGNNLAERACVWAYLSDDAEGDGVSAAAPDGGVAIGTDGAIIIEATANLVFLLQTDATGSVDIDISDTTGTPTWYLVVVLPNGKLIVSGAVTFA